MAAGNHIIHRQVIDISVSDKIEAQRWQKNISSYYKSTMVPALEKACDELCRENEHIRINRFELDLEKISRGDLRQGLTQELVKKFKEEILKVASEKQYLVSKGEVRRKEPLPDGVGTISGETGSLYDTIFHYFEYGFLPWWWSARDFSIQKAVDDLLGEINGKLLEIQFFEKLRTLLARKHCQLRVIHVCTEQQLIRCLDPKNKYILQGLYNDFSKIDSGKKVKYIFFKKILANADASGQDIKINRESAVRDILQGLGHPVEQPAELRLKIKEKTGADSHLMQITEKCLKEKATTYASKSDANTGKERPDVFEIENGRWENTPLPFLLSANESIEIANAGVVLLWPYLQMFFRELRLVEKEGFTDQTSQEKAVQLLHCLVRGEEEAEEHQWLLFKLLCSMEPADFVPTAVELDDSEMKECDNLLRSVIRNWSVLKSTSPAGLQSSFLSRPGLLKREHYGWVVHIERIAIDVLLDRLTWPISVIRLPSNKDVIHVKW